MKFTLTIDCDNAAFGDGSTHQELARLLGVVRNRVLEDRNDGILRDSNGNTVGRFELTEDGQ